MLEVKETETAAMLAGELHLLQQFYRSLVSVQFLVRLCHVLCSQSS